MSEYLGATHTHPTTPHSQPADVYHADQVRLAKSQVPLYRLHKY